MASASRLRFKYKNTLLLLPIFFGFFLVIYILTLLTLTYPLLFTNSLEKTHNHYIKTYSEVETYIRNLNREILVLEKKSEDINLNNIKNDVIAGRNLVGNLSRISVEAKEHDKLTGIRIVEFNKLLDSYIRLIDAYSIYQNLNNQINSFANCYNSINIKTSESKNIVKEISLCSRSYTELVKYINLLDNPENLSTTLNYLKVVKQYWDKVSTFYTLLLKEDYIRAEELEDDIDTEYEKLNKLGKSYPDEIWNALIFVPSEESKSIYKKLFPTSK